KKPLTGLFYWVVGGPPDENLRSTNLQEQIWTTADRRRPQGEVHGWTSSILVPRAANKKAPHGAFYCGLEDLRMRTSTNLTAPSSSLPGHPPPAVHPPGDARRC